MAVFFATVLLGKFSWLKLALGFTSWATVWLFGYLLYIIKRFRARTGLLIDYLHRYQGCSFKEFSAEDYVEITDPLGLGRATADVIDYERECRNQLELIRHAVRIVAVTPSPTGTVPIQLKTYGVHRYEVFVFVRDEPKNIRSVGRYFVLHEIGHYMLPSLSDTTHFMNGYEILFFLAWVALVCQWSAAFLVFLVPLAAAMQLVWRDGEHFDRLLPLIDETTADLFAVANLPQNDLERVSSYFAKYPLNDRRLDVGTNGVRNAMLIYNITRRRAQDSFARVPVPILGKHIRLERYVILFTAIALGTAAQISSPSISVVISSVFCVLLFLGSILLTVLDVGLKHEIRRILSNEIPATLGLEPNAV